MEYLVAIITGLLGLLWYGNNKRKQAEALNDNEDSLREIGKLDNQSSANKDKLKQEEDFRKQKEQELGNAKANDNMADVIDFLKRLNRK